MKSMRLRNAILGLSLAALAACGGGGGSTGASGASGGTVQAASTGTAVVSLTDAPGDFLHYVVNVTSIQLRKGDGTVVETLPATTQVDFAQLVNLSEIISAQQVPSGTYTSAAITLDYSAAQIIVDNGAGGSIAVPAANILNGAVSGTPAVGNTPVTLTLTLPAGQPLVINKGTVANLALDFSLAVSNSLSPAAASINGSTVAANVTVTVNPTLSASIAPDATKAMNLRGGLVSVDAAASSYTVHVRPFFRKSGSHGDIAVKTTSTTVFQINGASSTGSAGLTALAAVAADTVTLATGTFDVATKTFTADTVYVGTSLPGSGLDGVDGTVVARSGNTLTLASGLVFDRAHEQASFGKSVAVTVGAGTKVSKAGLVGSFDAGDISVGQHVQVSGALSTDANGNKTLDASAGAARLLVTPLWGTYVSAAGNIVTLDLQALDGRLPSAYAFAGTGSSPASDAVASAYTVGVPQALSLGGLVVGKPVRFFGFVNRFGAAPPAFSALSLVNYAATDAKIGIEFNRPAGNNAPFTFGGGKLVVATATLQATDHARMAIGPVGTDLKANAPVAGLSLQANASATATGFVIAHRKTRKSDSYASFADIAAALQAALPGGTSTTAVMEFGVDGPYDATTSTVSVNHLFVVLND
ncbi:MAG: hypothetical protein RLZZ393_485 [Pseudomonadota bacterium]